MDTVVLKLEVPYFSLFEHERRRGRGRPLANREDINIIAALPHMGNRDRQAARVHYLTGTGGNSTLRSANTYNPFDLLRRNINRTSGEEGPYL